MPVENLVVRTSATQNTIGGVTRVCTIYWGPPTNPSGLRCTIRIRRGEWSVSVESMTWPPTPKWGPPPTETTWTRLPGPNLTSSEFKDLLVENRLPVEDIIRKISSTTPDRSDRRVPPTPEEILGAMSDADLLKLLAEQGLLEVTDASGS